MKPLCSFALLAGMAVAAAPAQPQTKVYSLNADFDEGTLLNVNHDPPNRDQLQLDTVKSSFPFLYVACSGRGTICRIDVNTGQVVGEYRSAPEGQPRNPSRTTVDLFGNVWAGNRDAGLLGGQGSVVQVGVVVGGTRVNSQGQPDPSGAFLAPPFAYNTCIDRDGDGLLHTSMSSGDVLSWPDVTDGQGSVGNDPAFVADALDECIRIFQRTSCPSVRHLSVDGKNNVWVGGYPDQPTCFQRLDGSTGANLPGTFFPACGGFGGLIDGSGVLWSTSFSEGSLLRVSGLPLNASTACLPLFSSPAGSGLDSLGFLWVAGGGRVARISPLGVTVLDQLVAPNANFLGLAITSDDDVWIAAQSLNQVLRLDSMGTLKASIPVGVSPTGVAVDFNGKVWVTNLGSNNAQRIDPATDSVDLTVDLGANAAPFNLGDMAGTVALEQTLDMGAWDVVYDSNQLQTSWDEVSWTEFVPQTGVLKVEIRASDMASNLPALPFVQVGNQAPVQNVSGRFVQIQVTFEPSRSGVSPILFDLTIEGSPPPINGDCPTENRRRPSSLLLFPEFENRLGDVTVLTVTNVACGPESDVAVEFRYIDEKDCSEFNRVAHLTGCDTLTLLTRVHNPNQERGYVYAFAIEPLTREPIVFNHLIGQVLVINGIDSFDYSMNAVGFRGIGDGVFTDLNGDGLLALDGVEYAMAPDQILVPRFFGQSGGAGPVAEGGNNGAFQSDLILVALSGGALFDTTLDFLIYNDNEEVFSSEYTFRCWERVPLLEISGIFSNEFLKSYTNHAPGEILGASSLESGWFSMDGALAQSTTTTILDPAFYAVLIERAGGHAAADLPFELCVQPNGKLLPRSLDGQN